MVGRTYQRFAEYYDVLYRGLVDYEGDDALLDRLFRRYMRRRPRSLLDLGCGTGTHAIPFIRRGYEVTGLDASLPMLRIARRKAKAERLPLRLVRADMRSFRIGRTFDAAISLFGAFGYLLSERDVSGCLASVGRHLAPDGLFVFEYWQTSGVRPGHQSWLYRISRETEIIRLSEGRFDSRRSHLATDFRFIILRDDHVVDRFTERHVARTYTREAMSRHLARAGFDRLGELGSTPTLTQSGRITPETFRIIAVARPRAQR